MIPVEDGKYNDRTPIITYILILLNTLVFFGIFFSPNFIATLQSLGVSRQRLTFGNLLTSLFAHAGWFHLASNMFFLGFFGRNVERRLTPVPYIGLYLSTGILGAIFQVFAMSAPQTPLVGASASVYGVIAAYIALFPKHKIRAFYLFAPHPACSGYFTVPAFVYVLLFFVMQDVLMLLVMGRMSQVGHFAHLAGFSVGFVFALTLRLLSPRPERKWRSSVVTHRSIRKPRSRLLTVDKPMRIEKEGLVEAAGGEGEFWVLLKDGRIPEEKLKAVQQEWGTPLTSTFFAAKNLSEEDADRLLYLLSSHRVPAISVEALYIPSSIPVETVAGVGKTAQGLLLIDDTNERHLLNRDAVVFLSAGRVEFHHHKKDSMVTDRIFYSVSVDIISRRPFRDFRVVRHPQQRIDTHTRLIIETISDWAEGVRGVEELSLLLSNRLETLFSSFEEYDRYLLWRLVLSEIAEGE